jgi:DNA-binding SARP family transcriptional activator
MSMQVAWPTAGTNHYLLDDSVTKRPVMICLLGGFRLLRSGQPVAVRGGSKVEALLSTLAMGQAYGIRREQLLERLWPNIDPSLAGQSLNSLVYSVHKIVGVSCIVNEDGRYRLNAKAGVSVDIDVFSAFFDAGQERASMGDMANAAALFRRVVAMYDGDLCTNGDTRATVEQARLRSRYFTATMQLAQWDLDRGDCSSALNGALSLLARDPCREDAHRLAMRCYVRLGERAQALHQYRLCESILRNEFDVAPESASWELYDQIRRHPESV